MAIAFSIKKISLSISVSIINSRNSNTRETCKEVKIENCLWNQVLISCFPEKNSFFKRREARRRKRKDNSARNTVYWHTCTVMASNVYSYEYVSFLGFPFFEKSLLDIIFSVLIMLFHTYKAECKSCNIPEAFWFPVRFLVAFLSLFI